MARKYTKTSVCPLSAQRLIDFANSIPEGYSLDHTQYPEGAEKQKKWFFEIIATLPNNFADKYHRRLQKVLNGESVSSEAALQQKKDGLLDEVSKIPPRDFKEAWVEYLIDNGNVRRLYPIYPLYDLFMFIIQKAIPYRRVLTNLNTDFDGFKRTSNGKAVLPGEIIKDCGFTIDSNTGIIELAGDSPLGVIISERLDTRRFQVCPICDIFYWAKRLDAKTCGNKPCVNSLSGKKYQTENKEERNRKKREKYYKDNGIDFCPSCIRPLLTCECKT